MILRVILELNLVGLLENLARSAFFNHTIASEIANSQESALRKRDDLEGGFDRLAVMGGGAQDFGDAGTTRAIGLLGKAVLRLDKTSTRLAIVNIALAVVFLLLGVIQLVVMLRGRGWRSENARYVWRSKNS